MWAHERGLASDAAKQAFHKAMVIHGDMDDGWRKKYRKYLKKAALYEYPPACWFLGEHASTGQNRHATLTLFTTTLFTGDLYETGRDGVFEANSELAEAWYTKVTLDNMAVCA